MKLLLNIGIGLCVCGLLFATGLGLSLAYATNATDGVFATFLFCMIWLFGLVALRLGIFK